MNIEIRYPVTTLMRVLKRIKAPKKASYEAMDYFMAIHGDAPCTAYDLFMQMSDVIVECALRIRYAHCTA